MAVYRFTNEGTNLITDESGNGNTLAVPKFFDVRQRPFETFNPKKPDVGDFIINIFGFIPLGFVLFLWFSHTTRLSVLWLGVGVAVFGFISSLGIEWAQSFLLSRNSSISDVICNTIGTMLGVVTGYTMRKKKWILIK